MYGVNPSLITDKNITLLSQNAKYANHLGEVVGLLNKIAPELLTDENYTFFAQHPECAEGLCRILKFCQAHNVELITDVTLRLFAELHNTHSFVNKLSAVDNTLITNDNLQLLAHDHGKYAIQILSTFEEMIKETTDRTPQQIFAEAVAKVRESHVKHHETIRFFFKPATVCDKTQQNTDQADDESDIKPL